MLEQRIAHYLTSRIPGASEVAVKNLYRIPGGQSRETWSFDAVWRQNGVQTDRGFILRRDPDASVLESDREAEFRVMQAVHSRGVPIPEVLWLEQDLPPGPPGRRKDQASVLIDALKQRLHWLTPKILVVSLRTGGGPDGLTVTNLSRASQAP